VTYPVRGARAEFALRRLRALEGTGHEAIAAAVDADLVVIHLTVEASVARRIRARTAAIHALLGLAVRMLRVGGMSVPDTTVERMWRISVCVKCVCEMIFDCYDCYKD
jgi:hypothetical protein